MLRINSTASSLVIAALLAVAVGFAVQHWSALRASQMRALSAPKPAAPVAAEPEERPPQQKWVASAAGRVEPKSGEIRIGSQSPGKIAEVLVRMNDRVSAGDLLVRLQDDEPQARLLAAEAEAAVRRRERDTETVAKLAQERRAAEDAVASAERALHFARVEFDRTRTALRAGKESAQEVARTRNLVTEAADKLEQDRASLRRVQAMPGMPLQTRLEAALATARADLSLVMVAIERTRIRAPTDGTVLQVLARIGETVSPSSEDALIVFGDVSSLRVLAEVEERDVSKIRTGQGVVVRSDAFPGREFGGRIERMGQALGAPRLSKRGPRRPTDVDVLEVLVDLEANSPLLPGMRVDVFFKPEATVQAPVRTN
jgi:HlyD family secretion protein